MTLPGKIDLNDLVVFVAVAETGGFTAAATRLDVATAKISVEITRLETKLGVALFRRTTRKVALTDTGKALYEQSSPLLQQLSNALEHITSEQEQLGGVLRISTTVDHATQSLVPALAIFSRQHPNMAIDLQTSDRVVDLIDDGIDVSIRLGWLRYSSNRAAKLGEFEQYVVASPKYFTDGKLPSEPEHLEALDWIALTLLPTPFTWNFVSPKGESRIVHVKARIRSDSPGVLRSMLEERMGISVLDQFNAQDAIASKSLIRLLSEWTLPSAGIYAIYGPGRQVSAKVRYFIEFYRRYLHAHGRLSGNPPIFRAR